MNLPTLSLSRFRLECSPASLDGPTRREHQPRPAPRQMQDRLHSCLSLSAPKPTSAHVHKQNHSISPLPIAIHFVSTRIGAPHTERGKNIKLHQKTKAKKRRHGGSLMQSLCGLNLVWQSQIRCPFPFFLPSSSCWHHPRTAHFHIAHILCQDRSVPRDQSYKQ